MRSIPRNVACGVLPLWIGSMAAITLSATVHAGEITAVGAVTALTDVSQLASIIGVADFDEGPTFGVVPEDTYSADGLDLRNEDFDLILPGIVSSGDASLPVYDDTLGFFPAPIAGGGAQDEQFGIIGLVATFSVPVTQFGLTLSQNGTQFITAWDSAGELIGQVQWEPRRDSAFVGLDSGDTPIAMIAIGNDDVFAGAVYGVSGTTTIFDTAIWAAVPEPSAMPLVATSLVLVTGRTARRRVAPDPDES